MRPERLHLADLLEAADSITGYVAGLSRETFIADERTRSATLYKPRECLRDKDGRLS